jgi:transposase-like protein
MLLPFVLDFSKLQHCRLSDGGENNSHYRIDETYIKVKGEDKYLIELSIRLGRRSIPAHCQIIRIRPQPNAFCGYAIDASGNGMPRVMNVYKNPGYLAAGEVLKADGVIPGPSLYASASI